MKNFLRRDFCAFSAIMLGAGGTSFEAAAQDPYPSRPVVLIAPSAAGGLTDILARTVAAALGKRLNNPVIVENKEGAGGTVGMGFVGRAEPDGYTLILAFQGPATVAQWLYARVPYDATRDFTVIGTVGTFHHVLTVGATTPFKSAKDVIDAARRQPGKLTYGTPGVGSTGHLAGELFQQQAGIKLNHIPYKGESPALRDVAGGLVDMAFTTLAGTRALNDAGKVRMIGVASTARASTAHDLPTIAETGLPGFNVPAWYGVMAPKKTPAAVVERLRREVAATLKDPLCRERLVAINVEPWDLSVPQFENWLREDSARWKAVIETAGSKPE